MAEVLSEPHSPQSSINLLKDIPKLRAQNKQHSVNTLPAEVLSRIFAIGEGDDYKNRGSGLRRPALDTPVLASHVCSHWRHIAVGNGALWTSICVTRTPHHLAFLYLERAGPTSTLDLYFDLRQGYWDTARIATTDATSQMKHIPEIIQRFSGRNLDIRPYRWRSLCIYTIQWQALLPFVLMISRTTAPALKSITWHKEVVAEDLAAIPPVEPKVLDQSCSLGGQSLPGLKFLDFSGLPLSFISCLPSPTFGGLTHLSLACGRALFALSRLGNFLSANPQLESLVISTGNAAQQNPPLGTPICLPSLRSLTLRTLAHTHYLICIMHMIDAPELHTFTIESPPSYLFNTDNDVLAAYIETGKIHQPRVSGSIPKPFYPSVRELDISLFSCKRARMTSMLASLPQITHLSLCGQQAVQLDNDPPLLPNLVSLRFVRFVYPQLGDILRRRTQVGCPIKVVHLHRYYVLHLEDELPDTVEIQHYDDPQFRVRYEEVEDEGDLEFDEDYSEDEVDFLRALVEREVFGTGNDEGPELS